jgi:hypothetical protein
LALSGIHFVYVKNAFPAKPALNEFQQVGATTAFFDYGKATIRSVVPIEKGAIFSIGSDEKSLIINFSYNLYRFCGGYQKKLSIIRVFQKNLRKPNN